MIQKSFLLFHLWKTENAFGVNTGKKAGLLLMLSSASIKSGAEKRSSPKFTTNRQGRGGPGRRQHRNSKKELNWKKQQPMHSKLLTLVTESDWTIRYDAVSGNMKLRFSFSGLEQPTGKISFWCFYKYCMFLWHPRLDYWMHATWATRRAQKSQSYLKCRCWCQVWHSGTYYQCF